MKKKILPEQKEEIDRLRAVRENMGFSQEKFADILNISPSAYKKIENNVRTISLDNLKAAHRNLDVSVDYLLFGEMATQEQAWEKVLNCTETDKTILFLRLFLYFAASKPGAFPEEDEAGLNLIEVIQRIAEGQDVEE